MIKQNDGTAHLSSSARALDTDGLRALLRSNRLRIVDEEKLRYICDHVTRLRENLAAKPSLCPELLELRDGTLARAADQLSAALPALRGVAASEEEERRLGALGKALFRAREFLDPPPPVPVPKNWHDWAGDLAQGFRFVMLWAGHPPKGTSNEGPVARFVAAIIPFVSGEQAPDVRAVAQHLKRARRNRDRP